MKFIPNAVSVKIARQALKVQKHSPVILFSAGVVGMVATVVVASRATLKLEEVVDDFQGKLEDVRTLQHDDYSDEDRRNDQVILYSQASLKLVKLYGPAVMLGVASVACLTGSHYILTKRNAGLIVAYAGLEKAFEEYRRRVSDRVGEDVEREIMHPTKKTKVKDDVTGETLDVSRSIGKGGSPYARIFDESASRNWNKQPEYNQLFIQCQQQWMNDLLNSRGHLFLNEVYDALGLSRTKAGAVVGWVKGNGDDYVDFGVFRDNEFDGMRFVCGEEPAVWLDFNVDGVIYDKI